VQWLDYYIGQNNGSNGEIVIIDLSLVPSDLVHIITAVLARLIFEAHQRYRRANSAILPTTLVLEEAHNFLTQYAINSPITPAILCTQAFERIAKEGRKFGLGLLISSQRPSELSSTVLSQCNTFILHRIVNERDQTVVRSLLPDTLGELLDELPVLPTKNAFVLGWAFPLPVLAEMRTLPKDDQPRSWDPDYWNVWTGKQNRSIDWGSIVSSWYEEGGFPENEEGEQNQ